MANDREHYSLFVPPSIQDHIQGVLGASVVLIMYGDYECFQSANAYRLIKAVQRRLSPSVEENDVCFIFRHFPQIQIHPHAQRAAEAAEAAAMQGQFWQMHEMLFIPRFLQDLSKRVYVDHIIADIQGGYRSGVEAVPALFVNGIRYRDRWTVEQLMTAIIAANHEVH
jgi:protein-disulfide isomerase